MSRYITRSLVTFIVNEVIGAVIVLHELFFRESERPFFLALAGGFLGLPFILAADGKIASRWGSQDDDKEERWSGLP